MATEIVMPRLSDSMEEGTILKWLVAEGDAVKEGQALVEVETDKATVVHEAQTAGVILALTVGEGANVPVGAPIAIIGEAGEQLPERASPQASAAAVAPGPSVASLASAASGSSITSSGPPRPKASPLARRLAAEQGVDLGALAGSGPNGRVIRADVEQAAATAHVAATPEPDTGGA